ncbi:MarR family transcriptional regulator [Streptosporangium sp. NPDC006007]|uniref:MarR family winged helix-turn-helix transcriptional regulator n=1 Tax=Streptosporangium sp. NPDC006007 TaxID=3154575 RepID=UPI0033B2DD20
MTWNRFVRLHARVEAELTKALQRGHGLGLSEYRALERLAAAGGELRMQELADALGLNQSSVTRLVARLEEAGLTRRDLCSADRRGVYSVITVDGRARLTEAMPTYERSLAAALEHACADPDLTPLVTLVRGS